MQHVEVKNSDPNQTVTYGGVIGPSKVPITRNCSFSFGDFSGPYGPIRAHMDGMGPYGLGPGLLASVSPFGCGPLSLITSFALRIISMLSQPSSSHMHHNLVRSSVHPNPIIRKSFACCFVVFSGSSCFLFCVSRARIIILFLIFIESWISEFYWGKLCWKSGSTFPILRNGLSESTFLFHKILIMYPQADERDLRD